MPATPGESRATSAISEDWRLGILFWSALSVIALWAIVIVSQMVTGGSPDAALNGIARWTLSSAAHVEWSAPLLVTAAFALAAICAAPIHERVGFAPSLPLFAVTATVVSVTLSVWMACAAITVARLPLIELENPQVWRQFGAVSGIFLTAPLGIVAGLSAGRFQLLPPADRLPLIEQRISHLIADLVRVRPAARFRRLGTYRFLRYGWPVIIAAAVTTTNAAVMTVSGWPTWATVQTVGTTVVIYGLAAAAAAAGAQLAITPPRDLVRDSVRGRRPSLLGWTTGLFLTAGCLLPLLWAASLSALVLTSGAEGTAQQYAALQLATISPLLAATAYGIGLLAPVSVQGHRAAARRSLGTQLAKARRGLQSVREQIGILDQSPTDRRGDQPSPEPHIDSAASTS